MAKPNHIQIEMGDDTLSKELAKALERIADCIAKAKAGKPC